MFNVVTNDSPYVLQQDNSRPHTATYTSEWFTQDRNGMACRLPDLNQIENVWQIMKDRVMKIQAENFTD